MLTLRDIIKRVNQLSLRRNIQWDDISYDADAAIDRINAFIGATYPRMSELLTQDSSTYTLRVDEVDREIFPEQYIHSIVLPFIAMELLARDEEFTTIYNKYAAQVEDGLFNMFSNEFNRVPFEFRQNPDAGVFFASDSYHGKRIKHNAKRDLPEFKFKVHYHINNPYIGQINFVSDPKPYPFNGIAHIVGWGSTKIIDDRGIYAYRFAGWTRVRNEATNIEYAANEQGEVDVKVVMKSDLHLFAVWVQEPTLSITQDGSISILPEFANAIRDLHIPDFYQGIQVRTIPRYFCMYDNDTKPMLNLRSIKLPRFLSIVSGLAFSEFKGTSIMFGLNTDTPVTIESDAFAQTENLRDIIIPKNVVRIDANAFPAVSNKLMNIYVNRLESNIPDTWNSNWYTPSNSDFGYTVNIQYGFNG